MPNIIEFSMFICTYTSAKFELVIKEHKKEWLMPINEAIKKKMIKHSSIWKSTIAVLNEEGAKKRGLII